MSICPTFGPKYSNHPDLTCNNCILQNSGVVYFKLPVSPSTEERRVREVEERLLSRKRHVREACDKLQVNSDVMTERRPNVVLAGGRLRMCLLEKTASSFIQFLSEQENRTRGENLKKTDVQTFVIVREPYSRLLSAYFDKIFTRPTWLLYDHYVKYIVKHFRFNATIQNTACASGVTFPEFVRYTIHSLETDKERNAHFDPMHRRCQFCYVDYDYYVHLETLASDMEYVYQAVNATLVTELKDEQQAMRSKAKETVGNQHQAHCQSVEEMFRRTWYSFKARGFIATDMKLPLTAKELSSVTSEQLAEICWQAHLQSVSRIDKSRQRREALVEMYRQIPLLDRLKLREIFLKDFQLHGYDSTPHDIFPELHTESLSKRKAPS